MCPTNTRNQAPGKNTHTHKTTAASTGYGYGYGYLDTACHSASRILGRCSTEPNAHNLHIGRAHASCTLLLFRKGYACSRSGAAGAVWPCSLLLLLLQAWFS